MNKLRKIICVSILGLLIIPFLSINTYAKDNVEIGSAYEGKESVGIAPRNTGTWTSIKKISTGSPYLDSSRARRVTPESEGPGSISSGQSTSFSFSATASLSVGERQTIGGTWSASSNSSFSTTYKIPAGKIGYVKFTPRYRKIVVQRLTYFDATLLKTENITIYQPVKVGSYADGLYQLVTR